MSDEGGPKHYLVVDDDADSRAIVVEYLKSLSPAGATRITECGDGIQALAALDRDPSIEFIISDWDMPVMNGLAFLQRVKTHPSRANIPFLIMTSPISQEAEKIVLAAENLVDGYLIKPFRSDALRDKIDKVMATPIRGPQKQVLVVDDDPDARATVIEYLGQLGFKDVHGLGDGRAALEYLGQNSGKVGMVISDWEMPEINGLELLRACKGSHALEKLPFLMITSQSSIENMKVMQAARANVDAYLLKPFNLAEMRKRIEALIHKARTRSQVEDLMKEALDAEEHHLYPRAVRKYEDVLCLDPDHEKALHHLGDIVNRTQGVEAALPLYKRAVDANPFGPHGYTRLAVAYEHLGWIDKAIALLKTANSQIGFSAELHFHLGKLLHKKGYYQDARSEFERTLELQLDHQEARLMLEILTPKGN
jgi:two-component system chemotaxis response regulator CheY